MAIPNLILLDLVAKSDLTTKPKSDHNIESSWHNVIGFY
jgi:hypothetical protein